MGGNVNDRDIHIANDVGKKYKIKYGGQLKMEVCNFSRIIINSKFAQNFSKKISFNHINLYNK